VHSLLRGATLHLRALGLLSRNPRLWRYVVIPIAINLLVGATVYVALLLAGLRLVDSLTLGLPAWAASLAVLVRALLIVALLIATGFVLVRFGVVLGSPWYGRLSEEI
jgi:CysZ protein